MAHERQEPAVRRPGQRVHCSLIDEQCSAVAIAARGHGHNSFLVDKQQPAAIRREANGVSPRRPYAAHRRPWQTTHTSLGIGPSGELLTLAGVSSSRLWPRVKAIDFRIRRPGELADIETVVLCVRCDLARFRAMGRVCYPDITAALRVEYHATAAPVARPTCPTQNGACINIVECKSRWNGLPKPASQ